MIILDLSLTINLFEILLFQNDQVYEWYEVKKTFLCDASKKWRRFGQLYIFKFLVVINYSSTHIHEMRTDSPPKKDKSDLCSS